MCYNMHIIWPGARTQRMEGQGPSALALQQGPDRGQGPGAPGLRAEAPGPGAGASSWALGPVAQDPGPDPRGAGAPGPGAQRPEGWGP